MFTVDLSLVLVLQTLCLTLQCHSQMSSQEKVLYYNKPTPAVFSLSMWEQMS